MKRLIAQCDCGHFTCLHTDWLPLLGQRGTFDCEGCGMFLQQTVAYAHLGDDNLLDAAPALLSALDNAIAWLDAEPAPEDPHDVACLGSILHDAKVARDRATGTPAGLTNPLPNPLCQDRLDSPALDKPVC